jgi:hypothetical protein
MLKLIAVITGIDNLTWTEVILGVVLTAFMYVSMFALFALF